MQKKPDIIFIFSDQQRADTINERVTPNLATYAQEGDIFDSAYTCQPVCGPARACLQTGVYPNNNGCITNGVPMRKEDVHLADAFNAGGYETAYIGKWHLASKGLQYRNKGVPEELRGGYKYWLAADLLEFSSNGSGGVLWDNDCKEVRFDGIRADRMTDFAIDYINSPHEKPYFLFLSYLEPHHQNTSGRFECPKGAAAKYRSEPYPEDLKGLKGDYMLHYPSYLACCETLDDNVARIVDELKKTGRYDNTLIIYTSDHGCHFKTRNLEYKRSCHSASTHIPLVIFGGAYKKGELDAQKLVSLIDLPPTLLTAAGIDVPERFDGVPLQSDKKRDCVFVHISESGNGRCVITDRYVYSVTSGFNYNTNVYKDDYLYDKLSDAGERRNLINSKEYADVKKWLRSLLSREMVRAGEKEPIFKRRIFKKNI